jgi:shikimate dehydrogenase
MRVTARTRLLTLLGDPVSHSGSPQMQNAAFEAAGVDGVYVAVGCAQGDLDGFMRGLARAGGGGNVTIPYKERAATVLDVRTDAVHRTGACNTFWGDERGRLHGDNTDVEGFRRAMRTFIGGSGRGMRALLLGAGGAARAALLGLLEEGAVQVLIYNRTAERARAVARRIGGERARVVPLMRALDREDFDLIVNATSVGLNEGDGSPFDFSLLARAGAAMDLVYSTEKTPFVIAAEAHGIRASDGVEMLVQQGAVSFERWWEQEAPVDAMRSALRERLTV